MFKPITSFFVTLEQRETFFMLETFKKTWWYYVVLSVCFILSGLGWFTSIQINPMFFYLVPMVTLVLSYLHGNTFGLSSPSFVNASFVQGCSLSSETLP